MSKRLAVLIAVTFIVGGCTQDAMSPEQISAVHADCANVDQTISALEKEKKENDSRAAAGIGEVFPITAVSRLVTGSYGTNAKIATGEWAQMVDRKIAELKQVKKQCAAQSP